MRTIAELIINGFVWASVLAVPVWFIYVIFRNSNENKQRMRDNHLLARTERERVSDTMCYDKVLRKENEKYTRDS